MNNLAKITVVIMLITNGQISSIDSTVNIFPSVVRVLEGNNATVKCSYNGTLALQGARFTINGNTVATIYVSVCTFNAAGNDVFQTNCEGNNTFTITWKTVSTGDHGQQIFCGIYRQGHPILLSEDDSFIYVIVPVKNIAITSNNDNNGRIAICEDSATNLTCETTASRPAPNITWLYTGKGIIDNVVVGLENDLFITKSTLYVIANTSLHNSNVICTASNYQGIKVISRNMSFDILYSPKQAPSIRNAITQNGDSYSIIEGKYGSLTCETPISNPAAKLYWIGFSDGHQYAKRQNFVTEKIEWFASRHNNTTLTCVAEHECGNFSKSVVVRINVMYPPKVIIMTNTSIVEDSLLNISCRATGGKPEHVTYKWTRQKDSFELTSSILIIKHITRHDSSVYTCVATNIMKPTVGEEEKGESSESIYIDVLYSPTVNPIKNQTVTEGYKFNLSCPVNPGNPKATNITWTTVNRNILSTSMFLVYENISRKHAALYTCSVFNIMEPSNSKQLIGSNSSSFHLIVAYKATIDELLINEYKGNRNVTVKEHDNVTIYCNTDSLPTSTTKIKFQNGSTLISTNLTNNVSYNLGPVTCLDAGQYKCYGRNKHNSMMEVAKQELFLFVNCIPRPHPKTTVKSNVTTVLNDSLILTFSAVAFPLPTTVNWQKKNASNWTIIMSYNDASIRESGLTFNLRFLNMQQADFGQYKLVIINDIGKMEHFFTVNPVDRPLYPDSRKEDKDGSSIIVVIGVVSSFTGVIVIALSVSLTWCVRKRLIFKSTLARKDVVYQNELHDFPDNNRSISEYEQIRTNDQRTEKNATDTEYRHANEMHYEYLDARQVDNNEYSQLSHDDKQMDIIASNIKQQVVCDGQMDTPIYTNLKL